MLPPDVNESEQNFTPVGSDIRFGMGAVRNVGAHVVAGMVKAREEQGAFTTFQDFFKKVPQEVCNKRTIESVIKAGGFDSLNYTRRSLLAVHEEAVDASMVQKRQEANNQLISFPAGRHQTQVLIPALVFLFQTSQNGIENKMEREMIGLYVSDHPLQGLEQVLDQHATIRSARFSMMKVLLTVHLSR